MRPSLAALLTDFGNRDAFVGIMKGAILAKSPTARIVDLSHGVEQGDVDGARFQLESAVPYFPERTLFVVVVDPGVGTSRKIVWMRKGKTQFLGPDNGVFAGIDPDEVRSVENERLFLKLKSRTFHGRDVFAPVAGALLSGLSPSKLGPRMDWKIRAKRGPRGRVVYIDGFGNAITDLKPKDVPSRSSLRVRGHVVGPVRETYGSVPQGKPVALVSSTGTVELARRDGDLSKAWRLKVGDRVEIRK